MEDTISENREALKSTSCAAYRPRGSVVNPGLCFSGRAGPFRSKIFSGRAVFSLKISRAGGFTTLPRGLYLVIGIGFGIEGESFRNRHPECLSHQRWRIKRGRKSEKNPRKKAIKWGLKCQDLAEGTVIYLLQLIIQKVLFSWLFPMELRNSRKATSFCKMTNHPDHCLKSPDPAVPSPVEPKIFGTEFLAGNFLIILSGDFKQWFDMPGVERVFG